MYNNLNSSKVRTHKFFHHMTCILIASYSVYCNTMINWFPVVLKDTFIANVLRPRIRHFPNLFPGCKNCFFLSLAVISGLDFKLLFRVHPKQIRKVSTEKIKAAFQLRAFHTHVYAYARKNLNLSKFYTSSDYPNKY